MNTDYVFEISNLRYARHDGKETFRIFLPDFNIRPGNRVALVGPSGSGKTTVLDIVALLAPPESARHLRFTPTSDCLPLDLAKVDPRHYTDRYADIRARAIGYVPQRGGLMPFLNARQNITLGPECHEGKGTEDFLRLCSRLGLSDTLLDRKPSALSAGEQQRIAICRALLKKPRVIVADEPTAALDPENADTALDLFSNLAEEVGAALIIATHDRDRAAKHGFSLCEREPGHRASGERQSFFSFGVDASINSDPLSASEAIR